MAETKKCFKCHIEKPIDAFVRFSSGSTAAYCRSCMQELLNPTFHIRKYDKILRQKSRPWK